MRYPLWKLIFLLVFGPPAAAGWWYIWQDFQGVEPQVNGLITLYVASVLIPAFIILPLVSAAIYFIIRASHSSYRERQPKIPAAPILLAAFAPSMLAVAWVAFASVYDGNLPGGFLTWYLTVYVVVLLIWIAKILLFGTAVAAVCYSVVRALRWFRQSSSDTQL
jgi:hypothetical protein